MKSIMASWDKGSIGRQSNTDEAPCSRWVHSGTVREDAFSFSDAGEHVGIFSALTALISTDS